MVLIIAYLSLDRSPPGQDSGFALFRWIEAVLESLAAVLIGDPEQSDKVAHTLAYTALAAVGVFGFGRVLRVAFLAIGYGLTLEFLQGLGGVRTASLYDALANSMGVAIGTGIALIALRILQGTSP